jgi:hypothetical protein
MLKSLLEYWKEWGAPLLAGTLFPWQNNLTDLNIISDYFQPSADILSSIVAGTFCLAIHALLHRKVDAKKRKILVCFIVGFLLFLCWAIFLEFSLGITWFPDDKMLPLIRGSWIISYIFTFVCLTQTIQLSLMLSVPRNRQK